MNLVFVADSISAIGGIQRILHTVAQNLAGRGHCVHLIGIEDRSAVSRYQVRPKYQQVGLGQPTLGTETPETRRRGQELLTRLLADLGEGVFVMSSPRVVLWTADLDLTRFATIGQYNGSFEYARTHYHFEVIRDHYRHFNRSVFLSEEDAASFGRVLDLRNATWLPSPLSFAPVTDERAATVSLRLLGAGRLTEIKRFNRLIEAFRATNRPAWELHIVGDGEDADHLRRLASRPAARTHGPIIFRGAVPPDRMRQEHMRADLLALTSEHEGLGMVIAEAAAAGTPTVAFDVSGGVRSLVRHGVTGLLVPPGDVDLFAEALRTLMDDTVTRQRMGANAVEHIRAMGMTTDHVMQRWEKLLMESMEVVRQ